MSFTYDYPRPAVTVDCVVFGVEAETLRVLLIERGLEPFLGSWALPGGFVQIDETLEAAARRELREETGIEEAFLEQLFTFGDPGRDPRGRTITVSYFALVSPDAEVARADTDASSVAWHSVNNLPPLAFDHSRILEAAVQRLQAKVTYQPVGFELLAAEFTLTELQSLYEVILERTLDKRNFRKRVLASDLLRETGKKVEQVSHRAPMLYRFDPARYRELERDGFEFRLG